MKKIKYPITVYSVDDSYQHGGFGDSGGIMEKTFDGPPDTSKLHHFDSHFYKIEGEFFIDVHMNYDDVREYKWFLNKDNAKEKSKRMLEKSLENAQYLVSRIKKKMKVLESF